MGSSHVWTESGRKAAQTLPLPELGQAIPSGQARLMIGKPSEADCNSVKEELLTGLSGKSPHLDWGVPPQWRR